MPSLVASSGVEDRDSKTSEADTSVLVSLASRLAAVLFRLPYLEVTFGVCLNIF